jgi:hypothetical protein
MRWEVVDLYRSLPRSQKEPLARFFDFLESYPNFKGDGIEQDSVGRRVVVKFVARFKVVYWVDPAAKEIKVLKLERLSKI